MVKFDLKSLFGDRRIKLSLVLLIVAYVVVFHVFHTNVWKTSSKKYFSGNTDWLNFWHAQPEVSDQVGARFSADIHTEDQSSGDKDLTLVVHGKDTFPTVAIGSGVTSKKQKATSAADLRKTFQLFSKFLPSFCETASPGFNYHFYLAFDATDVLFRNQEFAVKFIGIFQDITSKLCLHLGTVSIHMVQCSHTGKPAWAQNDAMMEAYLDNVDYHYRVNDDTVMQTTNWTQTFVDVLNSLKPSKVGVVGPNHSGGNTGILTYDFVHRTHVDIFGFYYPRIFSDWYADGWITRTYRPNRCIKVSHIHLVHTLGLGQRYKTTFSNGNLQAPRVERDKNLLRRFINYTSSKDTIHVDGRRVICMSLFGQDPKYLWGAIRNAQVAPIFFPGWRLRIYVPNKENQVPSINGTSLQVPQRILNKLKQLGAQITYVKTQSVSPTFWRYLVIDDESVDYFIIRNAVGRLNERDAAAVGDWLDHQDLKSDANSLHCIRDHPNHSHVSIVGGLWGGKRRVVRRQLLKEMPSILNGLNVTQDQPLSDSSPVVRLAESLRSSGSADVLARVLWPLLSPNAYCHDSVSCDKWANSHRFPTPRIKDEFLGQEYDQYQEPVGTNSDWITKVGGNCSENAQ